MADLSRGTPSPLVWALRKALLEVRDRQAAEATERAERRAKMRVVDGGARRDAA